MLNKKIILSLIVCGFAALQATAQTAGNTGTKPVEQHGQSLGVIGKGTRANAPAQGTEGTPVVSGQADRPVQPTTANPKGAATVVSTPADPNAKEKKAAPKN